MHYYTSFGHWAGFKGSASTFMAKLSSRSSISLPVPDEDFDVLFNAVTQRLRMAATAETATLSDVVHECTDALEQLQQMLRETREKLLLQVLPEQNTGDILVCWASQQVRDGFARTNSNRRTA